MGMVLPVISFFFLQDTCEILIVDTDRKRAYVLPCASLRGMGKCQGLEAATLLPV